MGRNIITELTPRQEQAYVLVHEQRLTVEDAGIQMGCSKQNVSQLAMAAERKVKSGVKLSIS